MLPNSVSLNVKWHFCLFSTSELNDKWYLYLCILLGFCFSVALIFWKLWTTNHVIVILLWTMMLVAVMLLLWSFAKKNTWIFTGCCCCSLSENLDWILVNICDFSHCCSWSHHVGDFNWWGMCFWRFQFWKYHFYVCSDLQITFIHMFRLTDHCYVFHIRNCWNARDLQNTWTCLCKASVWSTSYMQYGGIQKSVW